MAQYQENLQFNLLALCQSPLPGIIDNAAKTVRGLQEIYKHMNHSKEWHALTQEHEPPLRIFDPDHLAEYHITDTLITSARVPDEVQTAFTITAPPTNQTLDVPSSANPPLLPPEAILPLWISLVAELKSLLTDYNDEVAAIADAESSVKGRKKDYTPVIHAWVTKLAEKGILEGLAS